MTEQFSILIEDYKTLPKIEGGVYQDLANNRIQPVFKEPFLSKFLQEDGPGIYFLEYLDVVVYVGKSVNSMADRVFRDHIYKNWHFDTIKFKKMPTVDDFDISAEELSYITLFDPYYNSINRPLNGAVDMPEGYLKDRKLVSDLITLVKFRNIGQAWKNLKHE